MKLYHYTSVALGETILSDAISQGHLMDSKGGMSHNVVWLTTDPRPDGHGLTRGNEKLTAGQIAHEERVIGGPLRNTRTHDKTRLRFTVELDPDLAPGLMSFMSHCKTHENKEFAKLYGLSAIVDVTTLSGKDLRRLVRYSRTKERTWWLSFVPVRTRSFIAVDFNLNGEFVPYDYEVHGRDALRSSGFAAPDASAQAEIAQIVAAAHAFERPKALVFCSDPNETPKVTVRGGRSIRLFEISSRKILAGEADDQAAALQGWVGRHEEQLLANWREAADIYYSYYPEQRRA